MAQTDFGVTSDFSPIASRYDETRELPKALLRTCYQRLIQHGLLPESGIILDAGCGTGQVSLPLAEMGYEIRGYDVSPEMLAIARSKCHPRWQVRYAAADVRCLPEEDDSVDAIVVSKLFQHVSNWQGAARELLRVLRPGRCLLHINETGAFGNSVRKFFAKRADALGFTDRYVGLRNRSELAAYVLAQGCEWLPYDVTDLKWEKRITYGDAFGHLSERLHAEFWYLPADTYAHMLADTARWIEEQPEGRNTVEVMKRLVIEVLRKSVLKGATSM